jgi:beta-1,2-mannobiose phosphorylase / 1,2-beta-oligomannan phosphorylase
MLRRLFNACLIRPSDLRPSRPDLEVIGTFNPGAIATENGVVILVRVVERPVEKRMGYTALPRWDAASRGIVVDWENDNELAPLDIRVVQRRRDGLVRLTFVSHLRVVYSRDGRSIDSVEGARFEPQNEYEEFGVEDPRIVKVGDTYYITYVAVSSHGAATALASTRDFKSFQRHGIIFYPENKDIVMFPKKLGRDFYAFHRPNTATRFCKPEMWLAASPDLIHWGRHEFFYGGNSAWSTGRIGAGAPPFETPQGWLEIYHGNSRREEEVNIGTYSGGVLLLDLDNPRRVLGASGAVFVPEMEYEREGFVPNVVFPTGVVSQDDTVLVYYGAADTCSAVTEFAARDLVNAAKS